MTGSLRADGATTLGGAAAPLRFNGPATFTRGFTSEEPLFVPSLTSMQITAGSMTGGQARHWQPSRWQPSIHAARALLRLPVPTPSPLPCSCPLQWQALPSSPAST